MRQRPGRIPTPLTSINADWRDFQNTTVVVFTMQKRNILGFTSLYVIVLYQQGFEIMHFRSRQPALRMPLARKHWVMCPACPSCKMLELREELLIDANKASPTSSHLYKYLIKQWGRRKEYTKIHDFLSINIKYIESKLTSSTREKERRKYLKAILELRTKKIV